MRLPVMPPVSPMLAKPVKQIPPEGMSYEPKWDGFRSIIFRDGDEVEIGSRNERPMTRYFPEVVAAVLANFPERAVIDGEIVVADTARNILDFEALQQRIHPATSRVNLLAEQTPASFIAFDLLAVGDEDLMDRPFSERRVLLEQALADAEAPIHLTPATTDRAVAVGCALLLSLAAGEAPSGATTFTATPSRSSIARTSTRSSLRSSPSSMTRSSKRSPSDEQLLTRGGSATRPMTPHAATAMPIFQMVFMSFDLCFRREVPAKAAQFQEFSGALYEAVRRMYEPFREGMFHTISGRFRTKIRTARGLSRGKA